MRMIDAEYLVKLLETIADQPLPWDGAGYTDGLCMAIEAVISCPTIEWDFSLVPTEHLKALSQRTQHVESVGKALERKEEQ